MPAPLRVGLTGGLASGKSTVACLLADAGFEVVDADQLVAEQYEYGRAGANEVVKLFGARYLDATGAVDKPRLARLVFTDGAARSALEAVIHPLVRASFKALAQNTSRPIVFEATRLVEAGSAPDFDLVVTVEAPDALRLERAMARGLKKDDALSRLQAQGSGDERRLAADRVIENDGDLAALKAKTAALVEELRLLMSNR